MDSILRNRWRALSSLHRYYIRSIVPILLLALSVTEAKAQTDVKFNDDVRYSQWVIESRLGDFYGNTNVFGFNTYDRNLTLKKEVTQWKTNTSKPVAPCIDYVAGLVAKATIEAADYYKAFDWAKPWFKSVEWYGNNCTVSTTPDNLDAINASKMYFGIYALANGSFSSNADTETASKATTQLGNALTALGNYSKEYKSDGTGGYAFPANTTVTRDSKSVTLDGGWFHKKDYLKEMWLDGQYMGPATLAQLIKGYSSYTAISDNDWQLITKQFSIVWDMCWDEKEQLLYHAFCSEARSNTWAGSAEIWTTAKTNTSSWKGMTAAGHSAAFWGRAEGWYFLALVDVLEQMEKAGLSASTNSNNNCYKTLKGYLDKLAAGIKAKQDATSGCWYQLIGKPRDYTASYYGGSSYTETSNYLESSCTAIFAAAYLKAIRLGLLEKSTYEDIAIKAYKGAVERFMKQRADGTVDLLSCCKSAGLGTKSTFSDDKFRDGSNAYYLLGKDVTPTSTNSADYYTEGKVMGAFIMAATEYERANEKPIRFSSDLAPAYTLPQDKAPTVEALGSGDISYKWYNASNDSEVSGATEATFTPTESGKYYCKATNGTTTIQTSTAQVTVNAVSNEGSGSGETEPSPATFVYTSGGNAYGSGSSFTVSDITVASGSGTSTSGYLQVGQSKVLTITPPDGVTITNVTITWTDDSHILQPSTGNPELSTSGTTSTWKGSSTSALSWTNSSSTTARIKTIEVTYSTGTSSSLSITINSNDATYDVGAPNVTPLSVTVTGAETISYQWYSNTTNSNEGSELISGANEASYTPPVTTAGTTYYYCIASAGVLSVTSDVVAVAVLNPSDLKTKYDAAWTPIANGTIEVGNLVLSSSKGAYSITTGNGDVATISGTTITALKAGTFTLSQAADDTYKEGSKEITVRIGTDVTSNRTNEYYFTAETTDVSDGMTITRKDITMTFGNDGFWSQPSADSYTGGKVNPTVPANNIPTAGTFYKFTPTKAGTLAVKVKLNTDGGKLRPLYVSENGTFITAKLQDDKEVGTGQQPAATVAYDNKPVTFNVKKGKDYYVYVTGSKLGFYGFDFTLAIHTVTYNMNDHGTQIESVTDVNTLPETLPTPTADGYTFVGWYTDAALTKEATPGASISVNTTLYAKWIPITDLFSLTVVRSTTQSVASQTAYDVTSDDATVTGGSAQLYNGHGSNPGDMITGSQINLNGSGGSYIKITLDNTLNAGDEIIINPSSSSFKLSAEASTSNVKTVTGSYVIQEKDAVVGQKVIYLYKGSNSLISDINITRSYPESDSRATFTYGSSQLTFTTTSEGTYTTTLEIGASKKGQTITITPSTKVAGATIKQGESTVSGNISITVPSEIGSTATSTYTVTSKDGTSTTTYEINVKLVKENVVLEYAQREVTSSGEIINIKKEWTWDKTANSTKPDFTNPTLKVYLAKADGTKSETEVKNVTGIKYMSDVTDVATVNETTGAITIQENANGGAKIYAILEGHPDYNDANTFFNIVVKQGYSYSVATDAEVTNGPSLNQPVYIKNGETNLVKMTFGGWKWKTFKENEDNPKLISTYKVNGSSRTDGWNKPATSDETEIASIDGYKTYISGYSDAVDESKEASKKTIYGSTRYGWFKPAEKRSSDNYLETYPYTLPVRGAYMTFEPTQNGTLTVYILQNGAWNTYSSDAEDGSYKNGDIIPGEFRPHSFYICNQRGLNADQFSPKSFTYTTKQKVQGDYYCDLTKNTDDPKNIASWKEFKDYMSDKEKQAVAANWNSGINGAQKIVKLKNGSYLAIQKGIVKYTFFVTANETYYLFSNFSKLGFCGANFVPSETVVPADDDDHKMKLDDEKAYPTITKPEASATGEDQYKYKFDGTVKGYVKGFTIPLFKSITLNREFKKDQWTTLSLPFNLTQTEVEQIFGKGTQVLVFDDAITKGTKLHVKFFYHEIQNILPGYPYLIRPTLVDANGNAMTTEGTSTDQAPTYTITNDVLTSFTVYDKAINPNIEEHKFQATTDKNYTAKVTPGYCTENTVTFGNVGYKYSTKYEKGDLFISDYDGKLYESEGDSYGKGYRSFIDYTGTSSASKSLTISFSGVEDSDDNGGTTEIKVAELDNGIRQALGFVGVYNLNGQKVAETTHNLPAGIYIVNGRKLVVK